MNGNSSHPPDSVSQYQSTNTPAPYQLQRTYSGQLVAANLPPSFGSSPPPHAHPSSRQSSLAQSPTQEKERMLTMSNGGIPAQDSMTGQPRPASQEVGREYCRKTAYGLIAATQKPNRANDPMSFANILSEPAAQARHQDHSSAAARLSRKASTPRKSSPVKAENSKLFFDPHRHPSITPAAPVHEAPSPLIEGTLQVNGYKASPPKPRRALTVRENEKVTKALAQIDDAALSDVDESIFVGEKERYMQKCKKRALEVDEVETTKRKVSICGTALHSMLIDHTCSADGLIFLTRFSGHLQRATLVRLTGSAANTNQLRKAKCMRKRSRTRKNARKTCNENEEENRPSAWRLRRWRKPPRRPKMQTTHLRRKSI